jgi:hypothetical protein
MRLLFFTLPYAGLGYSSIDFRHGSNDLPEVRKVQWQVLIW